MTLTPYSVSEAEMMPERLIGQTTTLAVLQNAPTGAAASTYRVIRAVTETECYGTFDSINSYDGCLVSLGACHWTLLYPNANPFGDGELAAFLAFVLHSNRDGYLQAYGNFGLFPNHAWTNRNPTSPRGAGAMWVNNQKKYQGWYRQHVEGVEPDQAATNIASLANVSKAKAELNYYRSWHWFFRWVMAGRTIEEIRTCMWDATRFRLQDILDLNVNLTLNMPATSTAPAGQVRINAPLSDVFTSEIAIAGILRCHVNVPDEVARANNSVGRVIREAIRNAVTNHPNLNWRANLTDWGDNHEIALINALYLRCEQVNDSLQTTMFKVKYWRNPNPNPNPAHQPNLGTPQQGFVLYPQYYTLRDQLGCLRPGRGTFHFDNTEI
jgi:hypothetical protein